jgi:hypothetical protein
VQSEPGGGADGSGDDAQAGAAPAEPGRGMTGLTTGSRRRAADGATGGPAPAAMTDLPGADPSGMLALTQAAAGSCPGSCPVARSNSCSPARTSPSVSGPLARMLNEAAARSARLCGETIGARLTMREIELDRSLGLPGLNGLCSVVTMAQADRRHGAVIKAQSRERRGTAIQSGRRGWGRS